MTESDTIHLVYAFPTALGLVSTWAALHGDDLIAFNAIRRSSKERYMNLVDTCRLTGPLIAAVSIACLIATLYLAFSCGLWLDAFLLLVNATMSLYLSIRWFLWSLRAR